MPRIQEGPAPRQVAPESLGRLPAERHHPLLRSLADAAHESGVEIDAGLLQADGLADAQSGAVEELDQCAVTQCARRDAVRRFDEALRLRGRQCPRQSPPASWQVELGRGVVAACPEESLVAEEGADGCDTSRNRCRREPGRAELREVLLELLRGDLADGPVEPDR